MFKIFLLLTGIFFSYVVNAQTVDPTRPLGGGGFIANESGAAGENETAHLSSILISAERKIAIINGQVLRESQTVNGLGAVVKKIETDAVTLQQGSKVWKLRLNKTQIRH